MDNTQQILLKEYFINILFYIFNVRFNNKLTCSSSQKCVYRAFASPYNDHVRKREKRHNKAGTAILAKVTEQTKFFSFFYSFVLDVIDSQKHVVYATPHIFFSINVVWPCMLVNIVFSFLLKEETILL